MARLPAFAAALVLACAPVERTPASLRLLQVRPSNPDGVFLNERLVFHFSDELDRGSVTQGSVRITSEDGHSARGVFLVERDELRFVPDPVRAADLGDGGYRAGTRYSVRLLGFPDPGGLRSVDDRPLEQSVVWHFRTVAADAPGPRFEDSSPETGLPVVLPRTSPLQIPPTGPIRLEFSEPLDPSSLWVDPAAPALGAADFDLRRIDREVPGGLGERIAVRARLDDNRDPRDLPLGGKTVLELIPERVLDPGHYGLQVHPETLHLRDFGGHPVWPFFKRRLELEVQRPGLTTTDTWVESFVGTQARSSADPGTTDGTARWSGNGRVEVRYPMAAGTGVDGELTNLQALQEHLADRSSIQAVRLELPQGCELDLGERSGTIALCAQGRLAIGGRFVRRGKGDAPALVAGETLSDLLQRCEREGALLTLLCAGGDLVLSGVLEVDGPLLLVAGGRIRFSGEILLGPQRRAVTLNEMRNRGEAGVVLLRLEERDSVNVASEPPLVIDPPSTNPLREALVFAVQSASIPPHGRAGRWRPGALVHGHSGSGSFRVRYLSDERSAASTGSVECVEDPSLLVDSPWLRLQVELRLEPGTVWDPPWVDDVQVGWERADEEAR